MSQESNPKSLWTFNQSPDNLIAKIKANDLVMAWAIDKVSRNPIYIFELDADHRGAKCDCLCVSCEMPLTAVNVAKSDYIQRPHFKHPHGAQRDSCLVLAARFAIAQQLLDQGYIELPQRKVSSRFIGLSGKEYHAWEVKRPERVRVIDTHFEDKATALLTLEDGRKIVVVLTGGISEPENSEDPLIAQISIDTGDDLSIAGMSPSELKERMTLLWAGACWNNHWDDNELLEIARQGATAQAIDELDWLVDDGTTPGIENLSSTQRRETLLHIEVKKILESEKRIHLPELIARVQRNVPNTQAINRETQRAAEIVSLHDVQLEKRLDKVIPDVIAFVNDPDHEGDQYPLLIEVTVTNTITEERMARIRATNFATMEIDIGQLGGVITRDELKQIVIEELVAKHWLHHPKLTVEIARLEAEIDSELQSIQDRYIRRESYHETNVADWAKHYEEAFIEHETFDLLARKAEIEGNPVFDELHSSRKAWLERLEDCSYALEKYGFPQANINRQLRLHSILKRLFSIKLNGVVGYNLDTCWQVINTMHMDQEDAKTWHTLYLIAINEYKPTLTSEHNQKIQKWRQKVVYSIQDGKEDYLRSKKYDAFLALLFPEMKTRLESSFGKKVNEQKHRHELYSSSISNADTTEDGWLKGKALEDWKREFPQAAKIWFGK